MIRIFYVTLVVGLIGSFVMLGSAQAQSESEPEITSVTAGFLYDNFQYTRTGEDFTYRFDGASSAVMFSVEHSSLLFAYGVQSPSDNRPGLRMIQVSADAGENAYIFDDLALLPLEGYIPVRVRLDYRGITGREEEGMPAQNIDTINLGHASLGAGAGVRTNLPVPVLADDIVGSASLVRGLGGIGDVRSSLDEVRLARTLSLDIEFRLKELLGDEAGLTIGFTYRTLSWTDQGIDSFFDFMDVVVGRAEGFERNSVQSVFRIGVNF